MTVIFNYLFSDEQPVTGDNVPGVMTKDEIQELIVAYRQYIAEGTTEEKMFTEEEMEEEIKNLERQYETAPEEEPELDIQVSDGTMTKEITGGDKYNGEEVLRLDAGTEDKRIFVTSPLGENGGTENHFGFFVDDGSSCGNFSEMNAIRVDEENWQTAAQGKLTISYADTKALCDDFFAAVGMTDVVLSDAYIIDDEEYLPEEFYEAQGEPSGPENYIYQLDYVRTVGGVPAANLSAVIGSGDDYSLPWLYERIMFRVNDNGIQDISWEGHTQTGEVINEDTGVIDFEEACEIFEAMIVTTYQASERPGPAVVKTSVSIDEIELSIMRVREQNASGRNGIYTPVWMFYGHVVREMEDGRIEYDRGGPYPSLKYPVLIINAVDGSVIDPLKGY